MIKTVSLGLLDGLDGIISTGRSVEALTNISVTSVTKDGGVDVIVVKEVTVTIYYKAAAWEIDRNF